MQLTNGPELWKHAKKIMPGGNQLLSKRSEQFLPDFWPSYYKKAKGVEVWDLDDNHFYDMSIMGVGACPLGYADDDVNNAVKTVIDNGSMCTLNCPDEVELAESLIRLHPWAEMVRYGRCGGEAMAMAIRIARAKTGRDNIAFCGYHGWHDWYLSTNLASDRNLDGHHLTGLSPAGVPRGLIDTALPFRYNCIEDLQAIVQKNRNKLAAVVMEPVRDHDPEPGFLESVRDLAKECNAVFIFDEVSSGYRLCTGGSHLLYNIEPDIAVFAKAMSNGYPMSAIIGKEDVMQAAQSTFMSSTNWTEGVGPAAAIATIKKYEQKSVANHLVKTGIEVQKIWQDAARETNLDIEVGGIPPLSHFAFTSSFAMEAQTLFTQLMLEEGFLAGRAFYATYSHKKSHIEKYRLSVHDVFAKITSAMENGSIKGMLRGPVAHSGFQRLT